ncbi:EpsI family protein [Candidatus Parcubacteria bacterium]|nr:MAG: EpsI family protein [Candidatus Parcubacteria bacterium]
MSHEPQAMSYELKNMGHNPSMKHFLVATILLIAALIYVNFLSSVHAVPLLRPLDDFPKQLGEFTMVSEQSFSDSIMESLGVDHYIMREYRDAAGYPLWLYIGYYESQSEGEIIHSPKHCMPGSGWDTVETQKISLSEIGASDAPTVINRMVMQRGLEKQLAHYWYQSRGRVVADEYLDRGYMILDSLVRKRSDGALIRITGSGNDLLLDIKRQQIFVFNLLNVLNLYLPN